MPSTDRSQSPLARWCSLNAGGEAEVDAGKIVNLSTDIGLPVPTTELSRVVRGEIVNSKIWPLIIDGPWTPEQAEANPLASFRSLSFLRELLKVECDQAHTRIEVLSMSQKRSVALGMRDLYFAAWRGLLDDEEKELLENGTRLFQTPVEVQVLKGAMPVSFHPSASHKMLKFVEDLDAKIPDETLRPYFAQIMSTPRLFAVFVDPADLSYHNFENIVPLDAWLEMKTSSGTAGEAVLSATLASMQQVQSGAQVWTGKLALDDKASIIIRQLADLDLYVPPLNNTTRGGERFIFNSSILSRSLTNAIQESDILGKIAEVAGPMCLADSFRFVNYVFRCNRFAPGTHKFTQHRDTPYYDAARSQISKYTLLLYLSSGTTKSSQWECTDRTTAERPALRIKASQHDPRQSDICFHNLESMQLIIFDQSLEHEGHPFLDTDKIFLRTELIFEDQRLRRHALDHHDGAIAGLFSEACYMTGHGVFDAELAAHAHKCYEKVNAMHWGLATSAGGDETKKKEDGVYLLKAFAGLRFLTNGYNYWFSADTSRGSSSPPVTDEDKERLGEIKDCATVALLDHCNCIVGANQAFRSLLQTEMVRDTARSDGDVFRLLNQHWATGCKESKGLCHLKESDMVAVFAEKDNGKPFVKRKVSWKTYPEANEQDANQEEWACCPSHNYENFDAHNSPEVGEVYEACCAYTRRKILGSPITLLGAEEEVVVNHENVLVENDKVYFLRPLPRKKKEGDDGTDDEEQPGLNDRRINFAACWIGDLSPTEFIALSREIKAPQFLVPPLQFREIVSTREDTETWSGGGVRYYHFTMDLFRNDWVVHINDDHRIPVPTITNDLQEMGEAEGERSAFLRKTPGYEYYSSKGLDIYSDEEGAETLQRRGEGTRRSARLNPKGSVGEVPGEGTDGMLVEKADDEWGTESEAEETDEDDDDSVQRRRRYSSRDRHGFLDVEAEVLSDEDDFMED